MRFALMVLTCLALSSCGVIEAVGKIAQVAADPSIPVGEPEEQPSEIALHVYAAAETNPNFDGEPSPVVLKIYALSSDHRFMSFDFFSLVDAPEETLGVTLLEVLDETQMEPDSYKIIGPYEIPKGAQKIGVIAEFLDIDATTWRTTIDIKDIGSDDRLLLLLLEEEARLVAEAN